MDTIVAHESLIVIFAKYPTPGRVKTRLIGDMTAAQAAAIHTACLRYTLRIVTDTGNAEIWLAISPDDADVSAFIGDEIVVRPQGSGDLGDRMTRIARDAFQSGYRRVMFIGCDCPTLTPTDLRQAFDGLDRHDLMIGPALDGGYYLIAMRAFTPALFEEIAWGSADVMVQTCWKAEAARLNIGSMPFRSDLDRPEDLRWLLADDAAEGETAALRDEIRRISEEGDASGCDG